MSCNAEMLIIKNSLDCHFLVPIRILAFSAGTQSHSLSLFPCDRVSLYWHYLYVELDNSFLWPAVSLEQVNILGCRKQKPTLDEIMLVSLQN